MSDASRFDPAHRVNIAREGAEFVVTVDPPHDSFPPERFADHKAARGWAGGIRLTRRWELIDQTEDGRCQPSRGR